MRFPITVDCLLDRTVVGYSRLGYHARRRRWAADDPLPHALAGKTVLVTGANSGIGKACVTGAASLGAHVLMVVRNRQRGEDARREVMEAVPGADLAVESCDVSDLTQVRTFATGLISRYSRIEAVIHNAGVMPVHRSDTASGHELALATHVLGPLLLTEQLLPALREARAPRVVLMSSGGMYTQPLPVDDIEYRTGKYRGAVAYARSKRIQVALMPILASRWAPSGVCVASMHPGWADTPGIAKSLPRFRTLVRPLLRDAEEAADTAVWLAATTPTPPTGQFWHDRAVRPTHYLPTTRFTESELDRVWRYCADAATLTA